LNKLASAFEALSLRRNKFQSLVREAASAFLGIYRALAFFLARKSCAARFKIF